MSNFPSSIDNDTTIPSVYDNVTEIGGDAINALKEAVINIEEELGISCSGSTQDLSTRLNVSINPDGTIKSSSLTGLGLVTLPINNSHIDTNAAIIESKLLLDHSTQDLYNDILSLGIDVDTALSWINLNGLKITNHINGSAYNHYSSDILFTSSSSNYLDNKFDSARDNSNLFNLLSDINSELVLHQKLDGYSSSSQFITTQSNLQYPSNFAHHASGLYIDSSRFISIPGSINDLQALAEFVDSSSLLLFGTRVQNFFSNGVSKASRSSNLIADGYGQFIINSTPAITYLRNDGASTSPVDNINTGDDLIEIKPTSSELSSNIFDAKFSQVKIGDVIDVNYGSAEARFLIKEKKYIQSGGTKKFIVRINGTNLKYSTSASIVISRQQYNVNKQHVLALAQANNDFSNKPSLISIHPRSASVLGIGFNPNLLDESHYNLYLQIYPNGDLSSVQTLPAIDVTGNLGKTPGKYTLDSIILETNNAFRKAGKNYRFSAFQYNGEFGIALSDPYGNTSFSIINAVVDSSGSFDQASTISQYPNNVIDVFSYTDSLSNPQLPKDALGFGIYASNYSSPPYLASYSSAVQSLTPTKIFVPLKKNFYYVNGSERDQFSKEVDQTIDLYGDGYWVATVQSQNIIPGLSGRVETTYRVELDLKSTSLMVGKTLTIQPISDGYFIDSGRFTISNITCVVCSPTLTYTDITVYDAVHGQSSSPQTTLSIGSKVRMYYTYDSIGFNEESSNDETSVSPFKRFFEIYIDSSGKTFSHERGRLVLGGSNATVNGQTLYASLNVQNFEILSISNKLKGYSYGNINKVSLFILNYDNSTGQYYGYLCNYNGLINKPGPITYGYVGEKVKFYDESNIDYIEVKLSEDNSLTSFGSEVIDIQLYPSLENTQEVYLIGNCTINQTSNRIESLVDRREFGNVSEQNLTNSAIDFISVGEKYLHSNGVVNGFELEDSITNVANNQISLNGGIAIINGKFVVVNPDIVEIPLIKERYSSVDYNILWALCLNDKNEYVTYPILDVQGNGNYYSSNRIFTAFNPTSSTTYKIESITKSKLLSRKDICLLYLVNSSISGTPSQATLLVNDARKFAYSTDSLLARVTSDKEFGNFRSFIGLINWLKISNDNISYANVKNITETINSSILLSTTSMIEIDGENSTTIEFNSTSSNLKTITLTNVVFKNMTINFSGSLGQRIVLTNSKLINCTISNIFTNGSSSTTVDTITLNDNSQLINCTISDAYIDATPDSSNAGIRIAGNNIIIDQCDFTSNYSLITDSTMDFIIGESKSNIKITNNTFSGTYKRSVYLKNCSDVDVNNNTVLYNFDAGTYLSTFSYENASIAASFEFEFSSSKSNFNVNNNIFTNTEQSARIGFIGFNLTSNNISLDNFSVSNNYLTQSSASSGANDFLSMIYLINNNSTTNLSNNFVYIKNGKINNNRSNNHQSIIISSRLHTDNKMYLNLVPINVEVDGNEVGNIGYCVGSGKKASTTVSFPMTYLDSNSRHFNLRIKNNNCHYIRLSDASGKTLFVTSDATDAIGNVITYPTADVIIKNNISNFIHVGCAYQANSSLIVENNLLPGYDQRYALLGTFANTNYLSTLSGAYYYSLFVGGLTPNYSPSGDPANGFLSNVIINNNIVYKGYWVNALGVTSNYNPKLYLRCDVSANIKNNIFRDTNENGHLILIGSGDCLIEGNKVYRGSQSVSSYMYWQNLIDGSVLSDTNPKTTLGMVINNIFDSSTRDGTNDNLLKGNFPEKWIVNQNINQVEYSMFSFISESMYYSSGTTKNASKDATVVISSLQTAQDDVESLITKITTTDTNAKFYSLQINISNHLPTNVKVIGLQANIRKQSGTLDISSSFNLKINKFTTTYSSPTNMLNVSSAAISTTTTDDPYFGDFEGSSISGTTFNAASVGDNLTIIPNASNIISESFIINNATPVNISFFAKFTLTSGTLDLLISPIVVKYRW